MSLHELPELRDAVLPAVCKLFSVSRQTAVLFADALVGNAEDASPMLRAAFAHSARSRFAAQAAQAEAAPCDRNGGYKSVYFTGKHVTCITRPLRFATLRQMLLELIVQSIMAERGHNVPRVRLALVRVVGTPVISLYQMVSQAERMQCTLAEFLASEAFAAMGVPERLGALVIALCSVCQGLYRLKSELGIRHGDLKPDNIMRRNADDANAMRHWCLIDFGQKVGEGGSDVFFLAWWLVHSYSRHVPPRLLRVLQRALRVPRVALAALPAAATYPPGRGGLVDFAQCVPRSGEAPVTSKPDETWRRQFGLTKAELYAIQRCVVLPNIEPVLFTKALHRLYVAKGAS
jgi:hypothetical protein